MRGWRSVASVLVFLALCPHAWPSAQADGLAGGAGAPASWDTRFARPHNGLVAGGAPAASQGHGRSGLAPASGPGSPPKGGPLALAAINPGAFAQLAGASAGGGALLATALVRSAVRERSRAADEVLVVDNEGLVAGASAKWVAARGAATPRAAARGPDGGLGLVRQAPSAVVSSGEFAPQTLGVEVSAADQIASLPPTLPQGAATPSVVAGQGGGLERQAPMVVYATTAQPMLAVAPMAIPAPPVTVVVASAPVAPTGLPTATLAPASSEDEGTTKKKNKTNIVSVVVVTVLGLLVLFGCAGCFFFLCYVRPAKAARSRALMNAVGVAIDGNRMTRGKTPSTARSTIRPQQSILHPTGPGSRDKSPASSASETRRLAKKDSEVFEA